MSSNLNRLECHLRSVLYFFQGFPYIPISNLPVQHPSMTSSWALRPESHTRPSPSGLGPDISLPSEASIDPLKSAFTAGLGPPVSQGDGLGPARDRAVADRGQR